MAVYLKLVCSRGKFEGTVVTVNLFLASCRTGCKSQARARVAPAT